jgi:DNA-binding NarL/FixJ family response regulator
MIVGMRREEGGAPTSKRHLQSYIKNVVVSALSITTCSAWETSGFLREGLTPRQREIVQLIAEGKSTKEIAFLLIVSVKTVETHRAQLMERLGIHDVAGLVRYAMRVGLVPPERQPEA